ncbi:MAG: fibronectin/fibrinogen-binding protein [Lachnospiraceae bacterium]|nr:fibronectin/fibrinogen-binding protein [Lachnospiraceae bacterium]
MAFDGITMAAVTNELQQKLKDGRVVKISQPEREEIILTVKNAGVQYRLFLCASPSLPLVYLTDNAKPSPMTAPNFCMVLRKHLQGARILSVTQPELERVLIISMEHLDEMGDLCVRKLVFELMGKYSNLILCDSNDLVIDSMKHVSGMMSSVREVLPGRAYFIPKTQNKDNPLTVGEAQFIDKLKSVSAPVYKAIYTSYTGMSPFIAQEICNQCDIDDRIIAGALSQAQLEKLYQYFDALMNAVKECRFSPVILQENNSMKEFAVTEILSYPKEVQISYTDPSAMLRTFYESKNTQDTMRQKSVHLRKQIQTILEKDYKKLDLQLKQLDDAQQKDTYRIYGELLNTYGYDIDEGAKKATVLNYYTNESVTIPLDENKSIKENAKRYFDKYVKLKRTQEALAVQIEDTKKEIEYLESVQTFMQFAVSKDDLDQIRQELYENHYIRKKPEKGKNKLKNPPLHYRTKEGYDIYVGRNNLQNDELTHKFATGNDWWFHAKGVPGSHVIVKAPFENQAIEWDMPDEVFEAAAALAAIYSKNKEQDKVEVDYLRKKNVKRPAGGEAGFVVYYTNYSMVIETNIERFTLTLVP